MISPECETLFGFLPTDFSLHSIYEFVCVEDLELLASMHRGILGNGTNQSMALRVRERKKKKKKKSIGFFAMFLILLFLFAFNQFKHKLGHLLSCDLAMSVYKHPETGKQQSIICSTHLLPPNSSSELYDLPPT